MELSEISEPKSEGIQMLYEVNRINKWNCKSIKQD